MSRRSSPGPGSGGDRRPCRVGSVRSTPSGSGPARHLRAWTGGGRRPGGRRSVGTPGVRATTSGQRGTNPHQASPTGRLILAVSDDPQSTKAWAVGAQGEQRLGRRLDSVTGPTVQALHDRRILRTRANIDHIVTCPSGVFVIDAKRYKGRPQLRVDGGIIRERTEKLLVGSRDCSKLVDGLLKQAKLVRTAIEDESIPVRAFLCFVDAYWPLFGGSFTTRDVAVLWPKKLADIITAPGPGQKQAIATIHAGLAKAFPIA